MIYLLKFQQLLWISSRVTANYAIKPTPELALRSNRNLPPARLIAALGVIGGLASS
jgi:hypothetical protein